MIKVDPFYAYEYAYEYHLKKALARHARMLPLEEHIGKQPQPSLLQ